MTVIAQLTSAFMEGWRSVGCKTHASCIRKDQALRNNLSEKQVDRMLEASFPASDPPSTY